MSSSADGATHLAGAPSQARATGAYLVEHIEAVDAFLARCERLLGPDSSPFHATNWLRAWYATIGCSDGRKPLLLAVRHEHGAGDAMLLPLVSRRRAGFRQVEFADGDVCDYVGPILSRQWHGDEAPDAAARRLWRSVRGALEAYDVFHIHKMLVKDFDEAGGSPNPLVLALPTQSSEMFGNFFTAPTTWDDWQRSLDKHPRKEIERSWRVFERLPESRFECITDVTRALELFETLETQQSERMRAMGNPYVLDDAPYKAFYRQAIVAGVANGEVVLTALYIGPQVVSALFGVANGARYVGLRQSIGGEAWKNFSPARLLDIRTAQHMHEHGRQYFDFGIGDYRHKRVLKMQHTPLADACVTLSWRGLPLVWHWRLRRWAKRQPWISAMRRRLSRIDAH